MRNISTWALCGLGLQALTAGAVESGKLYEPTAESITQYKVPEWYQDAKLGLWPIWGVYSVPAHAGGHAAEWYGRWMYCIDDGEPRGEGRVTKDTFDTLGLNIAAHHRDVYGGPDQFGYKDFVPMFKGENWDPDAWAQLAVDSGAKFFTMISEFHDGFAMYDSSHTKWDSVEMGPKRDITGELAEAVRKKGLKFGVSNHFAWNPTFYQYNHHNGFDAKDPQYHDLYSNGQHNAETLQRWWLRTTELAEKYKPDLYYFDWGWNSKFYEPKRMEFASFYYNLAIKNGQGTFGEPGVVLNYKVPGTLPDGSAVLDLERGRLNYIRKQTWQTDTSISDHSWGYSKKDKYKSPRALVHMLVDIVSKNGVVMLAFGPKADGTVPEEYKKPLLALGDWLKVNGEAIYGTRHWCLYGEGPNMYGRGKHYQGFSSAPTDNTVDLRFTRKGDVLYATCLNWPSKGFVFDTLQVEKQAKDASVTLLGHGATPWSVEEGRLHIGAPEIAEKDMPCSHAYVFKLEGFGFAVEPFALPERRLLTPLNATPRGTIAVRAPNLNNKKVKERYRLYKWSNPADTVHWLVDIKQPGEYQVRWETCSRFRSGAVEMSNGEDALEMKTHGAPFWAQPGSPQDQGTISFSRTGLYRIDLKVTDDDWPGVELWQIELAPIE